MASATDISPALLALLRCPETRQPLALAPANLLETLDATRVSGLLLDFSGRLVADPLTAGLVRADGRRLYPIRDGFPVLLLSESIALP